MLSLLFIYCFKAIHAKPIKFKIELDDGCFIIVEGDYTVDFNGGHFTGTVTSGGTSPHCPSHTAVLNFRVEPSGDNVIEILCDCTDICNANRIEFRSRNSNQSMVNYLNAIANTFLAKFKTHACN